MIPLSLRVAAKPSPAWVDREIIRSYTPIRFVLGRTQGLHSRSSCYSAGRVTIGFGADINVSGLPYRQDALGAHLGLRRHCAHDRQSARSLLP